MKKRFTEQQIIGFLKEAEAGMPVKELCRKHGFSDASFYTLNRPGNRGGCLVKVQRSSAQRQSGYGDRVLPPVQEEYSRWTRA
ncbi:transposase, partial [Burkholderia multivorans]|nr:transposase [Burkholderia multivorans]